MSGDALARYTQYDGMVSDLFDKAIKAMYSGSFEKATAYALLIHAAQVERDVANDELKRDRRL
jgi:hypothetical protein